MNKRGDSHISTADKRLLSMVEVADYLSLGKHSARKLVEDAGALVKIGGRVLADKDIIDNYLDTMHIACR